MKKQEEPNPKQDKAKPSKSKPKAEPKQETAEPKLSFLRKIFGGLEITWPKLIIFAIVMGVYTALVAMFTPEHSSLHDIAVTPEWWVLPAILIIVNSKKPLEAALKTFVFFLISQPLVYFVQTMFEFAQNPVGDNIFHSISYLVQSFFEFLRNRNSDNIWHLFGYYPYWFGFTLLTFPGAYLGWYTKKDEWYSGVILSVMTVLLALTGIGCVHNFIETPPNHLLTAIYCFAIIPVFILGIFKSRKPRIITAAITVAAMLAYIPATITHPFETYNNSFISENEITFVGEPYISFWSGEGKGNVEIIKYEGGYNFKITGDRNKHYRFAVSDDEHEYEFEYYYDKELDTVVVKKK